jgi:hypothetical protein
MPAVAAAEITAARLLQLVRKAVETVELTIVVEA